MTIQEFDCLDETGQLEVIWDKGVHLGTRRTGLYTYHLYQVETFYVEEKLHGAWQIRKRLRSFVNTSLLDPYLEQIDISGLQDR